MLGIDSPVRQCACAVPNGHRVRTDVTHFRVAGAEGRSGRRFARRLGSQEPEERKRESEQPLAVRVGSIKPPLWITTRVGGAGSIDRSLRHAFSEQPWGGQ